ncbi:pyrroloquinoline quinone biosynthesis peptide chaperone PqqD [Arcobacter cloacae]|uniref:Pyrroloquinoline quinone biosynthesis peptide chaperone PqqD n=1 Tax=Arcobacter cloacae TaxID=1054034 RepID=A0A4Q0ZH63_9BACT|nr:pyrroloquinoline quinone biosynthesis peptide chaperone PqqD [Arcobacter cloacae]RXJ85799.1 pyrroloquinoline quinone biosynthesis peptide chaperone PqqD [Arcobacter cloacae]
MNNIRINPNFQFQWEEKQNCYVLLYPEGMVQLNQSAGEILNLCDGSNDIKKINKTLCEKFELEDLTADITSFLNEAKNRDWIKYEQ